MEFTTSVLELNGRGKTTEQPVELACRQARQLEKIGDYDGAYAALADFWPNRNEAPETAGLDDGAAAELLLRAGALAGWQRSAEQEGTQETAKNLITRSIELFDKVGNSSKTAEARGDLGLCYWREGAYDEAR